MLIVIFTATKEAFDDYNRYKRDKLANQRKYLILDSASAQKRKVSATGAVLY
jgi:hypothetical protein